ncbi:hypothetical protein PIB30_000776 [Stylosanthes scabra]|uniref:Uncharacterized protein n=1 Tax=Stylosanthes scabra TaxID=79078 RepID=A0ABU6Q394_9FABA|nr:hypothetical protein [Stylosanthes scabra]
MNSGDAQAAPTPLNLVEKARKSKKKPKLAPSGNLGQAEEVEYSQSAPTAEELQAPASTPAPAPSQKHLGDENFFFLGCPTLSPERGASPAISVDAEIFEGATPCLRRLTSAFHACGRGDYVGGELGLSSLEAIRVHGSSKEEEEETT